MFRLLNVSGRSALEVDGAWYDLARLADDDALADPMAAVARSAELHDLTDRCAGATPDGAVADAVLGPDRCSPSGSTTPTTPPSPAWRPHRRR